MLLEKIREDLLTARKSVTKDSPKELAKKVAALTTLYSEAANVGLDDGKRVSTDSEVTAVIKKFVKNIDECLVVISVNDAKHQEYVDERTLFEAYLPKQLSRDELQAIILSFGDSNKGSIMKALKTEYNGQYDGKLAAELVDEILRSA
jgi:hypothetical protein